MLVGLVYVIKKLWQRGDYMRCLMSNYLTGTGVVQTSVIVKKNLNTEGVPADSFNSLVRHLSYG